MMSKLHNQKKYLFFTAFSIHHLNTRKLGLELFRFFSVSMNVQIKFEAFWNVLQFFSDNQAINSILNEGLAILDTTTGYYSSVMDTDGARNKRWLQPNERTYWNVMHFWFIATVMYVLGFLIVLAIGLLLLFLSAIPLILNALMIVLSYCSCWIHHRYTFYFIISNLIKQDL